MARTESSRDPIVKRLSNKIRRMECKESLDPIVAHEYNPDEGRKNDSDKLRWDLLPIDVIEQVVNVLTFGAKKSKEAQ